MPWSGFLYFTQLVRSASHSGGPHALRALDLRGDNEFPGGIHIKNTANSGKIRIPLFGTPPVKNPIIRDLQIKATPGFI